MSFGTSTTWSKPRSRKQTAISSKWTDLQPRERKAPGLKRVGKKGEFWLFVGAVVNRFAKKIDLLDTCEIASEFCDNYHRAWAHSRRRQDIRVGDFWYAMRVARACQECHFLVDAKGRREAEPIIEGIIIDRFTRMGLTEQAVKELLLECAAEIQAEDAASKVPRFQEFLVQF